MKVATSTTIARVLEIRNKLNSDSLDVVEKNSQSLEEGETAEVLFGLEAPLFVDDHSQISETGRLILQRSAHIVGGGIVKMANNDNLPSQTGQIKIESHKRSLAKAITWRVIATAITMVVYRSRDRRTQMGIGSRLCRYLHQNIHLLCPRTLLG